MVAYSFQKRFIPPITIGLGLPIRPEDQDDRAATMLTPKRQTIRAVGLRRHARPGETLQLFTGMRTKQCRLIGEATCSSVEPVIIWVDSRAIAIERGKLMLGRAAMTEFARNDGFANPEDMAQFWRTEHKGIAKFEGFLIRWEPQNGR
jgi:hypothetical protein